MFDEVRNIVAFVQNHPLTRQQPLPAFGRLLRWQIESRLRREVIFSWINGTRLGVKRGMTGATGNIYAGLHEFSDMIFVLHFLRAEDLFADVGANIGSYTVLAAGVAGARTISFEPDPDTVCTLRRNIDLNGIAPRVEVHAAAVGAAAGEAHFSIGGDTVNHVMAKGSGNSREVTLETLDGAFAGRIPALIKMDVEGYENEVLKGAVATLADPALKAVLVEDRSEPVTSRLKLAGFKEFSYDGFGRRLMPPGSVGSANGIFIRDHAFVSARVSTAQPISIFGRNI